MSAGEGIGMVKDKTPFTGGKHAFLIMAHKDDETLRTLLRTLDDPRNDIFIHMDSKNIAWDENSVLTSISKARIFPVPRISVTWGATRKSPASSACSTLPLPWGTTLTIIF